METKLLASLEAHIQKWMVKHCEDVDWPAMYIYDNQVADMARAAASVFDANHKGQKLYERESA